MTTALSSETADAIERSTQPSPDTDEEWYVHKNKREVVNRKGHYVAFTTTESDAAQIVADHNALPKLVAALQEMLGIVRDEGHADSYQPQCAAAEVALDLSSRSQS